ncbi:Ribonuclease H-like domain [Penicillium roqueforti FM164]|uniref:Ribonuclease H-like domain n=1 Tax=Penicillium roqueforti (strain FM164) TaxID=1365484 RepID=W6R1U5_PENRF|nr:Ribonuclease H-like domain [Penicillium roqueforti FM164]
MPPRIDLEPYKGEIIDLISHKTTHEDIIALLQEKYQILIGLTTLKSRLREWQCPVRTQKADIHDLIEELLPRHNTQDILKILAREGTPSSERTIRRVRADLSIKLRLSPEEREQQRDDIEAILISESIISDIEDFGRRTLHRHLRAMGQFYTEKQISTIYRLLRPDVIQGRLPGQKRQRLNYMSPGPNDVWHINGHLKLEPFGIEIYAAIDGYSRFIVWVYIGVSVSTAVSVKRQSLDAFAAYSFQPRRFRSDRGTETVLLADTQYELRKLGDPSVQINDCYLYGRSMDNQRIEAWWAILSRASTGVFRDFFWSLAHDNLFTKDCIPDQISLLAIYMPIIRRRVHQYTVHWNHHPIQAQPQRPHVIPGKPNMNFYYSDVPDLRCPIDTDPDSMSEQAQLFRHLQQDVEGWDPDEYLPPSTLAWCQQQLTEIGQQLAGMPFNPEDPNPGLIGDPRAPYRAVYTELRARAFAHWHTGQDPILSVYTPPRGAANWRPDTDVSGVPES